MDLNRLYFEHQIALMRAEDADDRSTRADQRAEADAIASRISAFHDRAGINAVPLLPAEVF